MGRTWNILLVDDDPDFLHAARRVLGHSPRLKANIETAQAASEALRIVEEKLFDVVVADYRMQPSDGAALLREVAQSNPGVRRVLLTGFDQEALQDHGVDVRDVDLIIDKNDPLMTLDRKLTEFLEKKPVPPRRRS